MPDINSIFYIKSSESPIFRESYESLKAIIKRIWGEDIGVYGTVQESDISREQGRVEGSMTFKPYFVLRPNSCEDNFESYNTFVLKKYGTEPKKASNGYYYSMHLKPVKLICSCSFYCQSVDDALKFMSTWSFNAREMTFTLDVGGIEVDIHVTVESAINMPSRDLSGPNPMRLETNLTLHTYVGNVYKIRSYYTLILRLILSKMFQLKTSWKLRRLIQKRQKLRSKSLYCKVGDLLYFVVFQYFYYITELGNV